MAQVPRGTSAAGGRDGGLDARVKLSPIFGHFGVGGGYSMGAGWQGGHGYCCSHTNDIILSTGLLCRAVQTYTYEVKPLTGELARKVWFGNVWLAQFEHIRTSICMHISQLEVTLC